MENQKLDVGFSVPTIEAQAAEMMSSHCAALVVKVVSSFIIAAEAVKELREVGAKVDAFGSYDLSGYVTQAIATYLKKICDDATKSFAGGTLAKCEYDDKWLSSDSYYRRGAALDRFMKDPQNGDVNVLAKEVVATINFNLIHREIVKNAVTLKQTGLEQQANDLCRYLSLVPRGYWRNSPYIKGQQIICETSAATHSYNYRRDREKNFDLIENALQMVGRMTGVNFGTSTALLLEAISKLKYEQKLASRTNLGKGSNLQIVCFKDKFEFRFSEEAFTAVMTFVLEHATGECAEQVRKFFESDWSKPMAKRA